MIDITLLGTSALMPLPERHLASALLTCAGRSILFDCGEGTQTAARAAGAGLMHVDVIALTHRHGDHVFGLPGLLQTLHCFARTQPLTIVCPQDAREVVRCLLHLAGSLAYDVRLMDMPPQGLALNALHPAWPHAAVLHAFPTHHRVPSLGYRFSLGRAGRFMPERALALGLPRTLWGRLQRGETIQWDGRLIPPDAVLGAPRRGLSLAYSGDTALCDALIDGARGCDLFLCEATFSDDAQAAARCGHMTFAQAAQAARAAGAGALWLTHFSQSIGDPASWLPLAQAVFPNTVCGEDGMRTTLRFDTRVCF